MRGTRGWTRAQQKRIAKKLVPVFLALLAFLAAGMIF